MTDLCVECEEEPASEEDPRETPLDFGKCICKSCAIAAFTEIAEEAEEAADDARKSIAALESK